MLFRSALGAPARRLVAAVASTADSASRAVPAGKDPAKRPEPLASPKMRAEIAKQKKSVADALAVIRAHALPPGSDMAFVFRPLPARRRK